MSSKNSALASLTAQYTDSENEDERNSDDDSPKTDGSSESQVIIPIRISTESPVKIPTDDSATPSPSVKKKSLRLVSYIDDTVISDEENVSPNHETVVMMEVDQETTTEKSNESGDIKKDKLAEYGFSLSPEPKGKCPVDLQTKINGLYDKMKSSNMDMNKLIQERKDFRNPSIYEKLIQFCDIDELGTNYPPEIYDPKQWGKESYYEELANAQKIDMEKREKERKESNKTEIIVSAKKIEDDAKKRKSKWDQPGPLAVSVGSQTNLKPAGLIQPSLTASITGTKGTIISAFGNLPKKPKT